jgi:septal ring factor EnvC (AmiA/AmiB activator)
MTEFSNDDVRLRAEEEQMRRALGLRDTVSAPLVSPSARPVQNGSPRPHRRFIRDGEVAVEVVHHEGGGTNQLEAARQAIRALTAVREQAERQLLEAQATIRDLETKLAHERLARDEAAHRAAAERDDREKALHSAQAELDAERAVRRSVEEQLATALERQAAAEQRAEAAGQSARVGTSGKPNGGQASVFATEVASKPVRPRGRPPKSPAPESDIVEWWKPGWKQRFR